MMSSSRMMNTNAMAAQANEVDFSFGAGMQQAQQPYVVGFDAAAGGMSMPGVELPLLQHHGNLYDSFDLSAAAAAGGFVPFQEPGLLPPASLPLAPPHPSMMAMAAMPPSLQLPLLTTSLPTAAEMYHPFGGGVGAAAAFLKREDGGGGGALVDEGGGGGTLGLNLGRRTYFSPADVLAVDRLLTRSARLGGGMGMGLGMGVLGLGLGAAHHHHHQPPRCQAEGCKADLSAAKHYHRRHKVCEFHAKAAAVAAAGKQQRFCQQCSRFHVLAEFDEAKRSCRKRLTEHNRRRRKPAGPQGKEDSSPPPKRADTCITTSCNSDHHKTAGSTAAAKSTAISPNGSGVSCLDAMDSRQPSSAAAAAPTALSLSALPLHDDKDNDDGGLDSMLVRQVRGRRRDYDDEEHRRFMTSLVMQQQAHQNQHDVGSGGHGGGGGGGGNILSCSSVSDQHNGGGCNGFFEVDFI